MNINESDLEFISSIREELQVLAEKKFNESHCDFVKPRDKSWESYEIGFEYGQICVTFKRSYSCSCCNDSKTEYYSIKQLFKEWLNTDE